MIQHMMHDTIPSLLLTHSKLQRQTITKSLWIVPKLWSLNFLIVLLLIPFPFPDAGFRVLVRLLWSLVLS